MKKQDQAINGTDVRKSLEDVKGRVDAALGDILDMGIIFNGLRAVADVLEENLQPNHGERWQFSEDPNLDLVNLMGLMGRYGAQLSNGLLEDGLECVSSKVERTFDGMMKEMKGRSAMV